MKEINYYFILNEGAGDGGEVTHAVLQGKIVAKPGAFDAFFNKEEAVTLLASEEIRRQMEQLNVRMEIVQGA